MKGANLTWRRKDWQSAFSEREMVPLWEPAWEEDGLRRKAGGTPGHQLSMGQLGPQTRGNRAVLWGGVPVTRESKSLVWVRDWT